MTIIIDHRRGSLVATVNKTNSRFEALCEVRDGKISYDARTGVFSDKEGSVSGARRRTLAELRGAEVIRGGVPATLTEQGRKLLDSWVD